VKERILDVLVCPYDKTWPLKIHIFEEKKLEGLNFPKPDERSGVICKFYCPKKGIKLVEKNDKDELELLEEAKTIDYEKDCKKCLSKEVIAGMIECPECHSFYPIIGEIALMLKSEFRNEDIEKQFTEQWADEIKKILPK